MIYKMHIIQRIEAMKQRNERKIDIIEVCRKLSRLKLNYLVQRAGISIKTYKKALNGEYDINDYTVVRLCYALDIDPLLFVPMRTLIGITYAKPKPKKKKKIISTEKVLNTYNNLVKGQKYIIKEYNYSKKTNDVKYTNVGEYEYIKSYDDYLLFKNVKTGVRECFLNNQGIYRVQEA